MALLDDLVQFVSDNTLDGSWQKPQLRQRCDEFLESEGIDGGGGGGNTVQTITGTLDNPWGSVVYSDLVEALENNDATAYLDFSFQGMDSHTCVFPTAQHGLTTSGAQVLSSSNSYVCFTANWSTTGSLDGASMCGTQTSNTIVSMTSYASQIPTTLTVIWHPITT